MNDVMLPIEVMRLGYGLIPVLVILYAITIFVKNDLVKALIYFFKAFAYCGLAFLMWKYYQGKEQIDIISAFTFIFCCFEGTDNILSLISIPVEKVRAIKEEISKSQIEILELMRGERHK